MNIQVVTLWYNESFLAPFFLNHYRYAERIHVILDRDTDDQTAEICARYPNVVVQPFRFPDKFDDQLKVQKLNAVYATLDCDWVYILDSDELLFPFPLGSEPQAFLQQQRESDLLYTAMWQVYRHKTDADLDEKLPAVEQRRHGDPNVSRGLNGSYRKPIVARAGLKLGWLPGCHRYQADHPLRVSRNYFRGAHWAMADPGFAVERKLRLKERLSRNNRDKGLGFQYFQLTAEQVLAECQEHLEDPRLF